MHIWLCAEFSTSVIRVDRFERKESTKYHSPVSCLFHLQSKTATWSYFFGHLVGVQFWAKLGMVLYFVVFWPLLFNTCTLIYVYESKPFSLSLLFLPIRPKWCTVKQLRVVVLLFKFIYRKLTPRFLVPWFAVLALGDRSMVYSSVINTSSNLSD